MQITIRMPDEYASKIETLSRKMGIKRSDVIRIALKQFLEEGSAPGEYHSPYEKVSHLLGIVASDRNDLGQAHRRYLIDKIRKRGK